MNIGDQLNRPLAYKIGRPAPILACGTIMRNVKNGQEIWGTGWDGFRDKSKIKPGKIHALRGPLTRNGVLRWGWDAPEIYGDPAILLPKYWKPRPRKRRAVGWIPHKKDRNTMEGYRINVRTQDIQWFIDEVCSCEVIYSSALHGLIIADAFGIPSAWVAPSWEDQKEQPWDFKYRDYYASIGYDDDPGGEPKLHKIDPEMQEELLRVCPWRR